MSGLSSSNPSSNYTQVSIVNSKFVVRAEPHAAGAVKRTNKEGKDVWEYTYDTLEGKLLDIVLNTEGKFGAYWSIYFQADGQIIVLNMSYGVNPLNAFASRMPNVDVKKPMSLHVFLSTKDANGLPLEIPRTVLYIKQFGNTVPSYFTKDNPNGMPELKKIRKQGKEAWDSTDRDTFLEQTLLGPVKKLLPGLPTESSGPALSQSAPPSAPQQAYPQPAPTASPWANPGQHVSQQTMQQEQDDLPF